MKLIVFILIALGVCGVLLGIYYQFFYYKSQEAPQGSVHLGPVPEGYDEPYFRKTGITKPLGDGR